MELGSDQTAIIPRANYRSHWIAALVGVFAFVLIGAAVINASPMLEWIGQCWAVSDRLQAADAAVVLGGGYESRPVAAARLYKEGKVRFVLVSTAGIRDRTDPNIDRQALLKFGVPANAIVEFGNNPASTYDEARELAAWAALNHLKRVIVPTETFSSRRVRWILRHELSTYGVDARVETMTPKFYNSGRWWTTRSGIDDFSVEIIKYLYYRLRYWRS